MGFELSADYIDVATRIAEFEQKHPDGCLRPVNPDEPYKIEAIGGEFFIVYAAAAYRSPDDRLPGIGVAWERFPGKTPYTKDSELQNAETSAWGRAIVAVLASKSKHVASAEDVRNRQADAEVQPVERFNTPDGELIEVWPGEVSRKVAMGEVVAAVGGDKDAAAEAWKTSGFEGRWKVGRVDLDAVLGIIAGAKADTSVPNEDERNDAMHAANAAYMAESERPTIDARAIAQRANALFEAAIGDGYPPRKKTWLNEQLRHALVYVATNGEATSSTQLEGAGYQSVWRLLDAIESGKLTFEWSADPGKGVEWRWPDGSTSSVLWTELNLAEAGAT